MALIETEEAARRLARAISSDLALYNEEKIAEGIQNDNLFEVMADEDGVLWFVVGTDSGFEGLTALYYDQVTVNMEKADSE